MVDLVLAIVASIVLELPNIPAYTWLWIGQVLQKLRSLL